MQLHFRTFREIADCGHGLRSWRHGTEKVGVIGNNIQYITAWIAMLTPRLKYSFQNDGMKYGWGMGRSASLKPTRSSKKSLLTNLHHVRCSSVVVKSGHESEYAC